MSFEPDILETSVYKAKLNISKQYTQQYEVDKGNIFDNKEVLILVVRLKALNEGFQFLTDRSAPKRCHLKCYHFNQCDWKLRARMWDNTEQYYITHLNDVHTCPKTQTYPNHRNANKKVIGHLLTSKLQDRSRVLRGKDIQQDILSEYKIHISYQQAMKGKHYGIQQVRGSPYKAFEMFSYYCYNLEQKNEGTITHIITDDKGVFEMLFIVIVASIRTFLNYLRLVLMIDVAHLKGLYNRTNLVVVAMDENNWIVPIAFGICKGETGPCWSWWMSMLKECIGDNPNLLFISYRHHAIAMTVENEFPLAFHAQTKWLKRMKSATWVVKGVNEYQYQVSDGAEQEHFEYEETKVSCLKIDLSSVLIQNNSSKEESFGENVRLIVLMKLQEALDEEAILEEQMLALMHRFIDRFTDRRVEINNLMVLHDHPLIDYGNDKEYSSDEEYSSDDEKYDIPEDDVVPAVLAVPWDDVIVISSDEEPEIPVKKVSVKSRRPVRDGVERLQWEELVAMVGDISLSSSADRWVCDLNGDGEFRVKDIRTTLGNLFLPSSVVATRWVKHVPIKVNIFAWRARLDRLPTRGNLISRGVVLNSSNCSNCDLVTEDSQHLFLSCDLAKSIAQKLCRWWCIQWVDILNFDDWNSRFSSIRLPVKLKVLLEGFFHVLVAYLVVSKPIVLRCFSA
nr:transposase, MuDR, MULE transposase domain protein [Tanacetum cinerariifolium]GEV75402.1 transposase, MuDR, MULE transposase domain protein [Tanacetum cinerariifolium]